MGKHTETEKTYAIKIIKEGKNFEQNSLTFKNETEILTQLDHPNIITLHESGENGILTLPNKPPKEKIFSVLELAEKGEIFDFIAKKKGFPESIARFYMNQLLNALQHCHSQGYSHRDIKLANILLDNEFNLILADFGFSASILDENDMGLHTKFLGTEGYMAPEIESKKPYKGAKADLFSVGVTLFNMVVGHQPFFKAKSGDRFYVYLARKLNQRFWNKHSGINSERVGSLSSEFKDLIEKLLAFDPEKRPKLADIREHPWFAGEVANKEQVVEELGQ